MRSTEVRANNYPLCSTRFERRGRVRCTLFPANEVVRCAK